METIILEVSKTKPIDIEEVNRFLSIGNGYGTGNGNGYGNGDGYGNGNGYGLLYYCNHKVLVIDEVETILLSIKDNYASGYIVNRDLTLTKTYVAKVGDYFAHGETLSKAFNDAQSKFNANLSDEEKISLFLEKFNLNNKYSCQEFFTWHNTLTGSCEQGRKSFMRDNNISFEDSFTVLEFLNLTKNSYNNSIINKILDTVSS